MIRTQTRALLVDAYRDLNARKMFWAVLILNVVVVAAFGALGVRQNRLSVLGWELPQDIPMAVLLYKWIFSYVIVGRWLTWAATILALISTASIFPDFLAQGTVDLYLSKPIGRPRLFLTKFITGLLFVALQVSVFTVGSFLVLGLRGGIWQPGLFWAVPIVLLFFSYLFSICALLGVMTRSTLAAFFLTLVAWFAIWGLNASDQFLAQVDDIYQTRAQSAQWRLVRTDEQIADIQSRIARQTTQPAGNGGFWSDQYQLQRLRTDRQRQAEIAAQSRPPSWAHTVQRVIFILNTLVPKTQGTIGLLDRALFSDTELNSVVSASPREAPMRGWRRQAMAMLHGRSLGWILGSSVAFECVVLALATWRFCRSDY